MKKGTTSRMAILHGRRILDAGLQLSFYVILGLGSYELSEEHARETARVLTEVNPTIFRFRTLNLMLGAPLYEDYQSGLFEPMRPVDVLKEERSIIAQLGPNVTSQVYHDHVSNYLAFGSENIQQDRDRFLQRLDDAINDPRIQALEPRFLDSM
jgi:radical SAM superfamily enzyme